MNTWNIRKEILATAHRWYWVVVSFLLGAILGWLISLILPAPYRAVQDIYVGLNAFRATRDLYVAEVAEEQFRNLDDYKNWQMGQLNSLALSDEYLNETLVRLQEIDQFWREVDLPELRHILAIAWRNTGDWHFSAQADNPDQAIQVVSVWSEVVTEKAAMAIDAARRLVVIDSQLQAVSKELVDLESREVLLLETQNAIEDWRTYLALMTDEQTLQPSKHWALISRVTVAANWNMGWIATLNAAPPPDSPSKNYLDWLDQVDTMIDAELSAFPSQINELTSKYETLASEYAIAADESKALSANLEVQKLNSEPPKVKQLRNTGTLILIGGFLGILVWGIIWLVQVTRRSE